MATRYSDRVAYAYCMGCGTLLVVARQARYGPETWHAWCAVTATWVARCGQTDRRN